jgi:hypothetical protein
MTRISNIPNPAYNADASSPTLLSRAAKFKSDLSYGFFNLINCKCKVASPRGGDRNSPEYREQAFLRKLSKGKMDSIDTMLALVRLTEDKDYQPFSKLNVTAYQAGRMLDNLQANGELITAVNNRIKEIKHTRDTHNITLSGPQTDYLNCLERLRDSHERLARELMKCARYEKKDLPVPENKTENNMRLEWALGNVWMTLPKDGKTNPYGLLQKWLVEQKDLRREAFGTKAQKEFAKNLKLVRDHFTDTHQIWTDPLSKMLTQALRKIGIDDPYEIVQKRMVQLVEVPKDIQAKLLPPLLEAMSDVIDGVGSARYDLAQALRDIDRAAQAVKETQHHITVLDSMVVAIKSGNSRATDQQFEESAYEYLSKFPKDQLIYFMAHVDTIKSSEKTELVQNALRRLANTEVLDTIDEYFQDYRDKNWDAARDKIAALDHNELAIIADFFDRNPWISDDFQKLADVKESAMSIAWIIHSVNELSHRQLGLTTPTSLSEAQKSDRERFLQIYDKNEGRAWHALYTFFGIPDEPAELPG